MFRLFCKKLGFTVKTSPILEPCVLPSASPISPFRYISSNGNTNQLSFTVSYLVNSCGLSSESALMVSKYVHFESPEKPDSALSFFRNHGFSETQISTIIRKCPKLLMSNSQKTILPKLEFFRSKGLSTAELAKIIFVNPGILHRNVKNHILPTFNFLKDLVHSDEIAIAVIKRYPFILNTRDLDTVLVLKINYLLDNGIAKSSILKLLRYHPGTLALNLEKIKKLVEEAKRMGFNPSKSHFAEAVRVLSGISKSTWERKVNVYKMWNCSEEEILAAFRKLPVFFMTSEDKIMAVMDLFVHKLGWESSSIAKNPALINYSLEKRLTPRASVLQFLVSKKLVKKDFRGPAIFMCPETTFLEKFVNRYREGPELLKLYGEKLAGSR